MSDPFVGEICMFGCNFAPRGWANCDGSILLIEENTLLFAVIGTIYGGNGRTTLGLPDLRGRAPMQWGQAPGLSYHRLGESMGLPQVALIESEIPAHDHIVTGVRDTGTSGIPDASLYMGLDRGNQGDNIYYVSDKHSPDSVLAQQALSVQGNSLPHENRQPYTALNFCIALDGYFPPRN